MSAQGAAPAPQSADVPKSAKWVAWGVGIVAALVNIIDTVRKWDSLWSNYKQLLRSLPPSSTPDVKIAIVHVSQFIIILVFVIVFRLPQFWESDNTLRSEIAGSIPFEAFRRFRLYWIRLWITWLVAYGWLTVYSGLVLLGLKPVSWLDAIADFFNIAVSFAIWCCFIVLDKGSASDDAQLNRYIPYRHAVTIALLVGIFCLILSFADRLFDFSLGHLGLACNCIYAGLAIACLVGRFDSPFIKEHTGVLVSLYFYAMIQLLYPFFDLLPIPWAIYFTCIVLKIVFAKAYIEALKSRSLVRYFKASTAKSVS